MSDEIVPRSFSISNSTAGIKTDPCPPTTKISWLLLFKTSFSFACGPLHDRWNDERIELSLLRVILYLNFFMVFVLIRRSFTGREDQVHKWQGSAGYRNQSLFLPQKWHLVVGLNSEPMVMRSVAFSSCQKLFRHLIRPHLNRKVNLGSNKVTLTDKNIFSGFDLDWINSS